MDSNFSAWRGLVMLRALYDTPLGLRLTHTLETPCGTDADAALSEQVYRMGGDLGIALRDTLLSAPTLPVSKPDLIQNEGARLQLACDLRVLEKLLDAKKLSDIGAAHHWTITRQNFADIYFDFLRELPTRGFGMFANHIMFCADDQANLRPVRFPDDQRLDALFGYARERELLVANTDKLLDGKCAAHALIYGDAGTGKSATVKAIVNANAPRGLRLAELKKARLHLLPDLLEYLGAQPLKFVVWMDDLSFLPDEDGFAVLKSALEGGASACAPNCVIYVTTNRRHLVKETQSERRGDEVHLADTLQAESSLAARFGLNVLFQRPDKDAYLRIVDQLAEKYGLAMPLDLLHQQAEALAIRRGGRTPRLAKQFVLSLAGEEYVK
ncbi:MAG: ATP-binding protein [Oscillospiraceae bacterium]|nr:ATP-binding protein [Oscillospiraceae bacterium]